MLKSCKLLLLLRQVNYKFCGKFKTYLSNEVWGKGMFLHLSVSHSVHRGGVQGQVSRAVGRPPWTQRQNPPPDPETGRHPPDPDVDTPR